jgi:hypothetical protein
MVKLSPQPDRRDGEARAELVRRVCDCIGTLHLTLDEAARELNLAPAIGRRILSELLRAGELSVASDGRYRPGPGRTWTSPTKPSP